MAAFRHNQLKCDTYIGFSSCCWRVLWRLPKCRRNLSGNGSSSVKSQHEQFPVGEKKTLKASSGAKSSTRLIRSGGKILWSSIRLSKCEWLPLSNLSVRTHLQV